MHYNMHIEAYACYNESGGHTRIGWEITLRLKPRSPACAPVHAIMHMSRAAIAYGAAWEITLRLIIHSPACARYNAYESGGIAYGAAMHI